MPNTTEATKTEAGPIESVKPNTSWARRVADRSAPLMILLLAAGIVILIVGNWNTWTSERDTQETDDAFVRSDLTPLSTKVAGLVARVVVSDYQSVKSGDLLVELRADDFRAQVEQAEAAILSGEGALINNQRQKDLQDARTIQAGAGIRVEEAEILAAEAGIDAAKSALAGVDSGIEGVK